VRDTRNLHEHWVATVHLTPREIEKLLIATAADLARKRRARGLKLNHPEAVALISAEILEAIRDGKSVSEFQVEGTFPDGTKLVTVHHPIH